MAVPIETPNGVVNAKKQAIMVAEEALNCAWEMHPPSANPSKNWWKDNAAIRGLMVQGLWETPRDNPIITECDTIPSSNTCSYAHSKLTILILSTPKTHTFNHLPEKPPRVERPFLLHLPCGSARGGDRDCVHGSPHARHLAPSRCQCRGTTPAHGGGCVYDARHVHASPRCAFPHSLLLRTPSLRVRTTRPETAPQRGGSAPASARSIAFPRNRGGEWRARPSWRRSRWRETWTTGTKAGTGGGALRWHQRACGRIPWPEWPRRQRPWPPRRGCRRCGGSGGVFRWEESRFRPCQRGEWRRWRRIWEPMPPTRLGTGPSQCLRSWRWSSIPEGVGRRTVSLFGKKQRLKSLENKGFT